MKNLKKLLFQSAATLTITSFLSYIFGMLRDKIFAYTYGASRLLDSYNAAFIIPDILLNVLVAGALTSAFLPIYTDARTQKGQNYAEQIFCSLLTIACGVLIVIGAIIALFMPQLVYIITPGFEPHELLLVARLSTLLLLSPLLFALSNSIGSVLMSHQKFLYYGLSPVFYNIGIIAGTMLLYDSFGIYGTVIGTIFGALLHFLIRYLGLKLSKIKMYPHFNFKLPELKKIGLLMLPKMAGYGGWQFLLWAFTAIASTLAAGSIVVYSFARNFQSVPVSLFGIALATAAFPLLSEHASKKSLGDFQNQLKKSAYKILLFTIPSAIGMAILSTYIIHFFLGGGKFDEAAISLTALTLSIYCFSIPSESLMHLLARAFYAQLDTLTPTIIQVSSICIAVGSAWYFASLYGVIGIPIGFGIGSWVQVCLLAYSLRLKLKLSLKPE